MAFILGKLSWKSYNKKFENSSELNLRLFGLAPWPTTDNHETREDSAIKWKISGTS